jgi:hypothetical protein
MITDADLVEAVAELIAYSDTQDTWLQRVADAWDVGRRQGHAAGYAAGYAQAVTDWKVVTKDLVSTVPAYAELDRRRYPPDGRLAWLQRESHTAHTPDESHTSNTSNRGCENGG